MPNNTLIGALRVEASLDSGKFVDGAQKISNSAKIAERDIKSAFNGMTSAIKGGIAGFTGALSVGAFVEIVQSSLDFAKSLQTTSQQLGISTKDLQTYRFAANQVGVTNEQLDTGFQFLEKSMGKANAGSVLAQKAFASVGVSLSDLKTKSEPEIFNQVADGMAKQGGAARNAAAATVIFGRSAADLNPLLDQGSAGIDNLKQAAQDLGVVLDEDTIKNANVTATKLADLKEVLQANIAADVVSNSNAILDLADALSTLIRTIPDAINGWRKMIGQFKADASVLPAFGMLVNPATAGQGAAIIANAEGQADAQFDHNQAMAKIRSGTNDLISSLHPQRVPPSNIPQFLKSPRRGHQRRQPADQSAELEAQFAIEEMQADQGILQAKQQLAGSAEQRLQLAVQAVNLDREIADAQVQEKVDKAKRELADKKITQSAYDEILADAKVIKAKNDKLAQVKLQAIVEADLAATEKANFDNAEQQLGFQIDALHTADQLATTAADHRRIQLEILDLETEQKRLQLESNLLDAKRNGAKQEVIDGIQAQLDHLPSERAQGAAQIIHNTQNPLEAWEQQVPHTAAAITEAIQSISVNGLDGLSKAIADVVTGTSSLKDAFHQLAASVLEDLLQMTIKMLLFRALTSLFGSLGGAAGGGASSPTDFSNAGSGLDFGTDFTNVPVTGFAKGGSITVGGNSGTDQNLLSLNGLPIARVSYGESINIANDNAGSADGMGPPVSLSMYNDFRGADPSAVSAINAKLDRLQAEFPGRVVKAYYDARARNVIRS